MNNSIYPCLTLKGKAAEAADFYIETFGEGKVVQTTPYIILMELSGQKIMLLNEGPTSLPNVAVSLMVICESAEETAQYWNKLVVGGQVYMELGSYPFSKQYGWVADKFGVSWQLFTGNKNDAAQKFCPTLMFTGTNAGKAREAVHFYTNLFPHSAVTGIMEYSEEDQDTTGFVKHAQFKINDFIAMAMDSSAPHHVSFNDAISFVVNCEDQAEIDQYWDYLIADGGREVACGWLTDQYGVSWQIIPKDLGKLITDQERGGRAMAALMKMKKLIIEDLENA